MDDQILIIDDDDLALPDTQQAGWKVMIVDDEPEVHRITKITLNKFEFDNRPIDFLHAYSAAEAKREFNFEVRHSPMPPDGTLRIP